MTYTERQIIALDIQQQDQLSSELASRSSFIGAIATLAAFLVAQWGADGQHPKIAISLYMAIVVAFGFLLWASYGQKYLYPRPPNEWSKWLTERRAVLSSYNQLPADALSQAEEELSVAFWSAWQERAIHNRKTNKFKAHLLSASGTMAVGCVIAVLILQILFRAGLF